jgi:hypothetical protein
MTGILQDLRYALRQLRKNPGFTAVAVLTLALGIGANTGIFTLVNAVLLKALPVPNPEQLYLPAGNDNSNPASARFSYPLFQSARAAMPHGSELAGASWPGRFYASFGSAEPEMVTGQLVSGNYFRTLETYAAKGRLLGEDDDHTIGGSPVAVISYGCWERRFARDPNIVGRELTVNGMPLQVVGVAAPAFFGTEVGAAPEFWLPTSMQSVVRYQQHYSQDTNAKTDQPWILQPDIRWLRFIVRAENAQVASQASAAVDEVFRRSLEQLAIRNQDPSEREGISHAQLHLVPGARGLPTFALHGFSKPLLALMAMAGIGPALRMSNVAPNVSLKTGGSTGSNRAQHRIRAAFIAAQMALALVLLVTSGLLMRVLIGLRGTDLGFNPEHLLTSEIDLSTSNYEGRDVLVNFYDPLIEKVRALPGVRSAGLIQVLPIQNWGWNSDIHIVGHAPDPPNQERLAEVRYVSSSYFDAMGVALLHGRLPNDRIDTRTSQPVMVVNEAFVKKFFAEGEDPLGQHIDRDARQPAIVGVVRNVRQNVYEPPRAEMDFPISEIPQQELMQAIPTMSLVVRTSVDTKSIVPDLRRVFHDLDPGLPFREPLTMREVVSDVLVLERLENWLFGTFASLAVLLAVVGLYGLISHEVELSIRDIGVRVALGATRVAVLASVYRRVSMMLGTGVFGGLLLVAAGRRLISSLVPLDTAKDVQVIVALAGGLFLVGIIAVLMPAKRASEVDPMRVLRYE